MNLSRAILSLLLCASVVGPGCATAGAREKDATDKKEKSVSAALTAGNYERRIQHDGRDRYYLLHIPPSYKPGTPMPVLLALHGGASNPENFRNTTDFDKFADEKGFIVAYPAGTGDRGSMLTWNILLSGTYATANKVDDIGFIKKVLNDIEERVTADRKRIFATGMSQGAMMCYELACNKELSGRIAAIAPVGGVLTVDEKDVNSSRPVPVIHFHGKEDPVVPYDGGIGKRAPRNENVPRPGVAASLAVFRKRNHTADKAEQQSVGQARLERYASKSGADVELWTLEDGGHTWPGGNAPAVLGFVLGKTNRDISANEKMWAFFEKHPLP